jgi:hypothetical protein
VELIRSWLPATSAATGHATSRTPTVRSLCNSPQRSAPYAKTAPAAMAAPIAKGAHTSHSGAPRSGNVKVTAHPNPNPAAGAPSLKARVGSRTSHLRSTGPGPQRGDARP